MKSSTAVALISLIFPLLAVADYEFPYINGYQTQCGGLLITADAGNEEGAVGSQTWNVNVAVGDLIENGVECQTLESHLTNQGLNPQNFDCDKSWDGSTWAAVIAGFSLDGVGNASEQIAAAINAGAPNNAVPCNNCCDPQIETEA